MRQIDQQLPILLEDLVLGTRQQMWFQQDGAPSHWAHVVRNHLNATFGRDGHVHWPLRSPDLTSPDFSCGATLKILSTVKLQQHKRI